MANGYRELVVKGDDHVLRGFIRGFQLARKRTSGIFLGRDHPINTHHLKEVLRLKGNHLHLIVSSREHAAVRSAIEKADLEFSIVSDRRISRCEFEFSFETFSREVAAQIKKLFRRVPVSLDLVGFKPKEEIDPSAKGPEMFAPVHDYTYRGKGKVRGDIERLLVFRQKLVDHEFVKVSEISLRH